MNRGVRRVGWGKWRDVGACELGIQISIKDDMSICPPIVFLNSSPTTVLTFYKELHPHPHTVHSQHTPGSKTHLPDQPYS